MEQNQVITIGLKSVRNVRKNTTIMRKFLLNLEPHQSVLPKTIFIDTTNRIVYFSTIEDQQEFRHIMRQALGNWKDSFASFSCDQGCVLARYMGEYFDHENNKRIVVWYDIKMSEEEAEELVQKISPGCKFVKKGPEESTYKTGVSYSIVCEKE